MTATDQYVLLRAFCDELARCGMRAACTSPGSRSAPLVLSLARERRIQCFSHLDERCAGFFAVGLAREGGLPVALACTSGTAAVELAPAVVEAHEGRVPLLVLTADRPPELRDVGAGQAIDQLKLYGDAAKWFFEVGTHAASPDRLRWIRMLACRAYWTALDGRPGPVHLNFPLREPLVPDGPLPGDDSGRPHDRAWLGRLPADARPAPASARWLAEAVSLRTRGLVVCGRATLGGVESAVAPLFAQRAGYPLLADPLSNARRGPAAVAHYDALLRDAAFAEAARPELVIRIGDLPTSKPLRQWLAGLDATVPQILIDPERGLQDPDAKASGVLTADPAAALAELAPERSPDAAWIATWRDADERAGMAIATALGDALSEPLVAAELGARLPAEATLFVASSMPVRDVESFFGVRDDPPRVLSNRGANGIDGTLSSAFGASVAGGPVVALVGDVALAHDIGALLAATRLGLKITIVLLNNDGGGIFHFLPVAGERDAFERHVATPHGLDFARAAELYRCEHVRVDTLDGFRAALDEALAAERTAIVEVRTERDANVALHRSVWEAVARALAP